MSGEQPVRCVIGHVLIVEDNLLVADVLKEMFRDLGFMVSVRPGFREGMASLYRQKYDIVAADLALAEGSEAGLALAQEARALSPPPKVILVSAHPMPDELHRGISFLAKPFRIEDVIEALVRPFRASSMPAATQGRSAERPIGGSETDASSG